MKELPLWTQLKSGNKKALEQIYRSTVQLLFRYGCRFTRDQQLVEDCIQDLFVELWQNRNGLGNTDSIERYLLAAIRRKVIRQVSKNSKVDLSDQQEDYTFSVEVTFEHKLIDAENTAENAERIKAAFEQLSKRQKEAIYLKYFAGLDYQEIEEVMKISYQSARNLVSGGLKKMKETVSSSLLLCFLANCLDILSTKV